MSWDKNDSPFDGFPSSIRAHVKKYLDLANAELEISHSRDAFNFSGENLTLPSRVYAVATNVDDFDLISLTIHQCFSSRHHNGYVRERAIEWLVKSTAPAWTSPYILAALGDYVIQIATVVCNIEDRKVIHQLQAFAKENGTYIGLLKARIISYWDAYYRTEDYHTYEPYKFLDNEICRTKEQI